MSHQKSHSQIIERRGELLAELFFEELAPKFVSRPTSPDVGYDLLAGFTNGGGGINTFAVQVKATQRPPGKSFPLPRRTLNYFAHSNIPGILLVADVKQSQLYYAWLTGDGVKTNAGAVSIPLIKLDDAAKEKLERLLKTADNGMAVAG